MTLFPHRVNPRLYRLLRLLPLLGMMLSAGLAEARPGFLDVFLATYHPDVASPLGKAKCGICHTDVPRRNSYGKDLKKLVDASSDGKLTAEMLHQVEPLDSDGDSWSNGDEIKQGFLPGDPTSHPSGKPSTSTASGNSLPHNDTSPLIPTHAFHPAFVHFPIALFIFGAILEFIGLRSKNVVATGAALWNLVGALVSMAIVTPTGVAAWLLGEHKLQGNMLIHLILAVSSLLLMVGTLVSRKRFGSSGKIYWLILILATVIIGLTGHFGGQMVYG